VVEVLKFPAQTGHRPRLTGAANRLPDRQANRGLYPIVLTRMACCPRTRAYVTRRTAEGKSKKEIIRCLKPYVAREIFKVITSANAVDSDLPLTA
jgi:transposase